MSDAVTPRSSVPSIPKSIVIVDQLPLTVVGKVLRKDVRKKYWENSDRAVG